MRKDKLVIEIIRRVRPRELSETHLSMFPVLHCEGIDLINHEDFYRGQKIGVP